MNVTTETSSPKRALEERASGGGRGAVPAPRPPHILVVGLGNELLTDDGVGVHAARALGVVWDDRLCVAEVGTAVLDALHLFEWADRVLAIDAMQAGDEPGTIYRFRPHDVARAGTTASLHELGLVAALRLLGRSETSPAIEILGVEPQIIDYGLRLSPPVERALPRLLDVVRTTIAGWQRD